MRQDATYTITKEKIYSYDDVQIYLSIENQGPGSLTYTVNGVDNTLASGASWSGDLEFVEMVITPAAETTVKTMSYTSEMDAENIKISKEMETFSADVYKQASGRMKAPSVTYTTDELQTTSKMSFFATSQIDVLQLIYGNYITSALGGDADNSNEITVKFSVEHDDDIYVGLFNGYKTIDIDEGGIVKSDELAVDIPEGDTYFVRTLVEVDTIGDTVPEGYDLYYALQEGTASGDETENDSASFSTSGNNYCPYGIIAKNVEKAIIVNGDSITRGTGDYATSATYRDNGFINRALLDTIPYVNIAKSGEKSTEFFDQDVSYRRRSLVQKNKFTSAYIGYGINDVETAGQLENIKTALQKIWDFYVRNGISVFQATLTPVSTSTDSWATVENQTTSEYNDVRIELNEWIRSSPSPLSGYIEVADIVETERDSGLWLASHTSDGIHPNPTGHDLLVEDVDITKFK